MYLYFIPKSGSTIPSFPKPKYLFPRTAVIGATKFKENIIAAPKEADLFWEANPMVTVGDAIKDLPPIENGNKDDELHQTYASQTRYQKLMKRRCKRIHDHVCANKRPKKGIMERILLIPKRKKLDGLIFLKN